MPGNNIEEVLSQSNINQPPPPAEDEDKYDIVKATQFGLLRRCTKLLDEGFDVNQRDGDNITLLHWGAINCRKDIVKLYIDRGAIVDAIGGELYSTPLHWATRQGHLNIVVFLMKYGADPTLRDGEGCSAIHLASQFGYTSIVAYLLAKGISPDMQDRSGMTPLMWSACRIHNSDPTRLLLTFGANTSIQDRIKHNTALHWAVGSKNGTAFSLLVKSNASVDIPNANGETALSLLKKSPTLDWTSKKLVERTIEKAENNRGRRNWISEFRNNEDIRAWMTAGMPFIAIYFLGLVFSSDIQLMWKVVLLFILYLTFRGAAKFVCDEKCMNVFPINVYLATKFWMYVVWLWFISPVVPTYNTGLFIGLSLCLWYSFIRAWRGDPGSITLTKNERYKTIIDLAEEDGFDPKFFCTTCLVRKPLRSKHCSVCDRCVAKFDHHCPWLSNCVGWKNHKYFIYYLFSLVMMCAVYVMGAIKLWNIHFGPDWSLFQVVSYLPWVNFMMGLAVVHGSWVLVLLLCQLYQILWLGITTNERLNYSRYSHFTQDRGSQNSSHSQRPRRNIFTKGVYKNFVDFFEIEFLHPTKIDWGRTWVSSHTEEDDESDSAPFIRNPRDNYQYTV